LSLGAMKGSLSIDEGQLVRASMARG
jgi:hypothetical protein